MASHDDTGHDDAAHDDAAHDQHHEHVHASSPQSYGDEIAAWRAAKDAYFKASPQSPIPSHERASFSGLAYFDVDPRWRFVPVFLEPIDAGLEPELQVQTSDGAVRAGRRAGILRFSVDGVEQRLTGLQLAGSAGGTLFVPFADATSGSETYGAGRYLDLEPLPDGSYDLDFNVAYAPFCAYSPHYSCPLPPPENRLSIAIRAGERER